MLLVFVSVHLDLINDFLDGLPTLCSNKGEQNSFAQIDAGKMLRSTVLTNLFVVVDPAKIIYSRDGCVRVRKTVCCWKWTSL